MKHFKSEVSSKLNSQCLCFNVVLSHILAYKKEIVPASNHTFLFHTLYPLKYLRINSILLVTIPQLMTVPYRNQGVHQHLLYGCS